jgi:hypothetical protein
MKINYFNEERSTHDELARESQVNWKGVMLELIESVSNDLVLNEAYQK